MLLLARKEEGGIMALGETLLRSLQRLTSAPHEASGAERAGAMGEAMVAAALDATQGMLVVPNPLIPHPRHPTAWLESDLLVYAYGKLFCIEVKNYRGRITYPPGDWTRTTAPSILQVKHGRYGECLDVKQHPHPLRKTTAFIYDLKRYLGNIDPRYARLYINPVVVFGPQADIGAVHDPAASVIGLAEIERYLYHYGQPPNGWATPPFIAQMFGHVPSWDWVRTTRGEWHNGVLAQPGLCYTDRGGVQVCLPWGNLRVVSSQPGSLFTDDTLTLQMRDGRRMEDFCRKGSVMLECGGHQQLYDLHHLREIVVKVSAMGANVRNA